MVWKRSLTTDTLPSAFGATEPRDERWHKLNFLSSLEVKTVVPVEIMIPSVTLSLKSKLADPHDRI